MSTRVLVVDDEQSLAKVVASYLERDGHEVSCVFDGPAAVAAARAQRPDVVVLDLGLPGLDGIEVCRQVRTFADCYIVMLTARADEVDKLVGLGVGADDYLTKPFSPRELVARVRVMLRRPRTTVAGAPAAAQEPPRVFGSLSIDVTAREVTVA
ncbi:response regulator transcription factor, partial [Actinophytocola sp.]|uniref:response regulator transcription factor n=1 Tax=Actinophytocola sp. TaxID=1872138 RepID=UPI002D8069E3